MSNFISGLFNLTPYSSRLDGRVVKSMTSDHKSYTTDMHSKLSKYNMADERLASCGSLLDKLVSDN